MIKKNLRAYFLGVSCCLISSNSAFSDVKAGSATVTSTSSQPADSGGGAPAFLPVWKLMSGQEKLQFIAGYIQGWKDAAKVTDIAIDYVKSNPTEAVDGLERIRRLYGLSGVRPSQIVDEVDDFYSDPDNMNSPLSVAVTAAKNRVH